MPDSLRPIFARVAGAAIGALAAWLAGKYGVIVPEEAKGQLTEGAVALMMLIFGLFYAGTHKLVSAKTNPADAASTKLAVVGKAEQKGIAR